jgi:hypothetical protein
MTIEQLCFKLGVKTYTDTYYTNLLGSSPTKIGQNMPMPIGWIYGISIDTDSVNPTDKTLPNITAAQASNLWLYFKIGAELFINNMRLDKLIYYGNATSGSENYSNQQRYFTVNIPRVSDLKESYYNNPQGYGTQLAPLQIPLTIYYINVNTYDHLLKKGYIFDGAVTLPDKNMHQHSQPQQQHPQAKK